MTPEWLRAIWPLLISAAYLRGVGIDPCSRIRSPVNVAGAKHDFCKSRQSGAHTCRFWTDDIFDGVTCGTGDDSSARIGLNGGREKAERERCLSRRGEYLESERTG